jgi:hypothetical protein
MANPEKSPTVYSTPALSFPYANPRPWFAVRLIPEHGLTLCGDQKAIRRRIAQLSQSYGSLPTDQGFLQYENLFM